MPTLNLANLPIIPKLEPPMREINSNALCVWLTQIDWNSWIPRNLRLVGNAKKTNKMARCNLQSSLLSSVQKKMESYVEMEDRYEQKERSPGNTTGSLLSGKMGELQKLKERLMKAKDDAMQS